MDERTPLHLFEGFGIELEYMVVARDSLSIAPIADRILEAVTGEFTDFEDGEIAWSNELVLHVIELKTNGPAGRLAPLPKLFQADVRRINGILEPLGARLMPTAMHPWMDPATETRLWPHDYSPVYEAFDRIFGCSGHGWSNLQSTHLNLPFGNDEEFGRLHAAIRVVLPILPALAASSPVFEGRASGILDNRLEFYRNNSRRVPAVAGQVIPERADTRQAYEQEILERVYEGLAPFDPDGILRYEWSNARGAIARFDRDAIEIRVLDIQECPWADLAVVAAIVSVLRGLIDERWGWLDTVRKWPGDPLAALFRTTLRDAEASRIDDAGFLRLFGFPGTSATAGELWSHLVHQTLLSAPDGEVWREPLELILEQGPLARRILRRLGIPGGGEGLTPAVEPGVVSQERIAEVYGELCACLAEGRLFRA
ncbi:MAG: glutamate-cysteine ligase family protein [Candidatus Eisenbacteria bacterium]